VILSVFACQRLGKRTAPSLRQSSTWIGRCAVWLLFGFGRGFLSLVRHPWVFRLFGKQILKFKEIQGCGKPCGSRVKRCWPAMSSYATQFLKCVGAFRRVPTWLRISLMTLFCACVTGWGHSSPARHAGNVLRCSRLPVRSPAVLLQQPYQHFESRGSVVTQAQWPCGHGGRHTHYAPNIRLGESRLVCLVNSSRRASLRAFPPAENCGARCINARQDE
jgi:hypothetical protein